jgi:hypothetical protein
MDACRISYTIKFSGKLRTSCWQGRRVRKARKRSRSGTTQLLSSFLSFHGYAVRFVSMLNSNGRYDACDCEELPSCPTSDMALCSPRLLCQTVSPVDGIDARSHGRQSHPPVVLLATKLIDLIRSSCVEETQLGRLAF